MTTPYEYSNPTNITLDIVTDGNGGYVYQDPNQPGWGPLTSTMTVDVTVDSWEEGTSTLPVYFNAPTDCTIRGTKPDPDKGHWSPTEYSRAITYTVASLTDDHEFIVKVKDATGITPADPSFKLKASRPPT